MMVVACGILVYLFEFDEAMIGEVGSFVLSDVRGQTFSRCGFAGGHVVYAENAFWGLMISGLYNWRLSDNKRESEC
jgi:hypothetical protein